MRRQERLDTEQRRLTAHAPWLRWPVVAGLVALVAVTPSSVNGEGVDSVRTQKIASEQSAAPSPELVINGGFENGLSGWHVNQPATTALALGQEARSGSRSASVTATSSGTVVLNDLQKTVRSTAAGESFRISAYLKSTREGTKASVRIREVNGGALVGQHAATVRLTRSWQQVSLSYTAAKSGSDLDLNILGWMLPKGQSIVIDDVSVTRVKPGTQLAAPATTTNTGAGSTGGSVPGAGSAPTSTANGSTSTGSGSSNSGATGTPTPPRTSSSAPTSTVPAVPAAPTSSSGGQATGCMTRRGIPTCGGPYVGAATGSNDDPVNVERTFGRTLGLRRTYFSATQVDGAVRTAQTDLAAGRLPWISFKLPHSWTDMANGKGDAWAADIATKLGKLDGPVWVAFHHEPEKEGNVREWARMQARLSPIVRDRAPNVAFTIIVMGWHQIYGTDASLSFDNMWPGDGLVDVLAIDPYNFYGKDGSTKSTELKDYYTALAAFANRHGAHWGVAETGYTDALAARDAAWLVRAYTDMRAMGGVALSYFNSGLNSTADWTLETTEKINAYKTILASTNYIQ